MKNKEKIKAWKDEIQYMLETNKIHIITASAIEDYFKIQSKEYLPSIQNLKDYLLDREKYLKEKLEAMREVEEDEEKSKAFVIAIRLLKETK